MIDDIIEIPVRYPVDTVLDTMANGWLDTMVMPFGTYGNKITISQPIYKYKTISRGVDCHIEHTFLAFERMNPATMTNSKHDGISLYLVQVKVCPNSPHKSVNVYRPLLPITAISQLLNGKESLSFRTLCDVMRICEQRGMSLPTTDRHIADELAWNLDVLKQEYALHDDAFLIDHNTLTKHLTHHFSTNNVRFDPITMIAKHRKCINSKELRPHLSITYRSRGYGWLVERLKWTIVDDVSYAWPFNDDSNRQLYADFIAAVTSLHASDCDVCVINNGFNVPFKINACAQFAPFGERTISPHHVTHGLIARMSSLVENNGIQYMRIVLNWLDEIMVSFRYQGKTARVYGDLGVLGLCSHAFY